MNYVTDKVKRGIKRGCVHFDTPSQKFWLIKIISLKLHLEIQFKRSVLSLV